MDAVVNAGSQKRGKGISGSTLKLIAIGAMFIDHFAAILLERYLIANGFVEMAESGQLMAQENIRFFIIYMINMVMRLIGRLGFPIFCFLLIEGFGYTRSKVKYALRLALFALISEIPFDLGFKGQVLEFTYQNVFFTLLLGLLTIWGIDAFMKRLEGRAEGKSSLVLQFIGAAVITAAGMAAAELLKTDYAAVGVATIVVMFLVHNNYKIWAGIMIPAAVVGALQYNGIIVGLIVLAIMLAILLFGCKKAGNGRTMTAGCGVLTGAMLVEFTAFATVPLVRRYNGKRGLQLKYVFYLFYPVHILLLALIAMALGI